MSAAFLLHSLFYKRLRKPEVAGKQTVRGKYEQ